MHYTCTHTHTHTHTHTPPPSPAPSLSHTLSQMHINQVQYLLLELTKAIVIRNKFSQKVSGIQVPSPSSEAQSHLI